MHVDVTIVVKFIGSLDLQKRNTLRNLMREEKKRKREREEAERERERERSYICGADIVHERNTTEMKHIRRHTQDSIQYTKFTPESVRFQNAMCDTALD